MSIVGVETKHQKLQVVSEWNLRHDFIEHRDFSFVVIGGAFMIKDFTSMLNL